MHTAFFGLCQSDLHDFFGNALNLDVHLQSGDTNCRTRYFKVHVAEVIFVAQNVGQNREFATVFDQVSMAIPATRAFIGTPASISAKQPPQTEAIDDEPFDSVISETTRTVYMGILPRSANMRSMHAWPNDHDRFHGVLVSQRDRFRRWRMEVCCSAA